MRPIPRALLPHTATLADTATDAYGAVTLTHVIQLTRVRVELEETLTLAKEDTQTQRVGLLVYDVRNSHPAGVAFSLGQFLLFEGRTYRVVSLEPINDGRRLHHIEAGLSAAAGTAAE